MPPARRIVVVVLVLGAIAFGGGLVWFGEDLPLAGTAGDTPGDSSGPAASATTSGTTDPGDGTDSGIDSTAGNRTASDAAGEGATTITPAETARGYDIADSLPQVTDGIEIAESPTVSEATDLQPSEVVVLTTQGYYPDDETADLVAFTTEGNVVYHEADYGVYFDVDPVPGTEFTVEYLASKHYDNETVCSAVGPDKCTRDVLRRVNLTTGASETLYAELNPRIYAGRQHDVDRINETHVAMAGIVEDRVYIVNTTSNETVWEWRAEYDYRSTSGGKWFDWTHLNDVEVLPDGRLMASLRNQDSVVFLDPNKPGREALIENWTLGADGNHSILHKQHNPDYIPQSRGGPAVVIGDSENHRAVEYQRRNGTWVRTWTRNKSDYEWVRDADRLPNGNTLIVSTRNDRVYGVGPNDERLWTVDVGMPYDIERLGTGDESTAGVAGHLRDAAALAGGSAEPGDGGDGPSPGPAGAMAFGLSFVELLAVGLSAIALLAAAAFASHHLLSRIRHA